MRSAGRIRFLLQGAFLVDFSFFGFEGDSCLQPFCIMASLFYSLFVFTASPYNSAACIPYVPPR